MTESSTLCGRMDKPSKTERLAPVDWNARIQSCPDCDTKRIGQCKNPDCSQDSK